MPRYSHLVLPGEAATERYTATRGRGVEFRAPDRNRQMHGTKLIQELQQAAATQQERFPQNIGAGFYESPGLTLTFESDPDFPLAFEALDLPRSNIELLSVKTDADARTMATVHVPDDKINILLHKLEAYRDFIPGTSTGKENKKLATSISNIRLATLRELWTDDSELYPGADTPIAWEVWLRAVSGEQRAAIRDDPALEFLQDAAHDLGYEVVSSPLRFVDRTVVLVRATREQLSLGADVLGVIAEVRKAKVRTDFFSSLTPTEQHEWSDELVRRVMPPGADSPAVGLLDTGVNHRHPLLVPVMADSDVQSLRPHWGVNDSYPAGHGTQMAGLALYGDLAPVLANGDPILPAHGLQSLKLIQQSDPHSSELYGTVTIEGVSRLEVDATRQRVYCLSITADGRDQGRPSSWSAAIDNLACGAINDTRRLVLVSAGNTTFDQRWRYPVSNENASIEDPAQAWNALTVGGYTEKVFINEEDRPGWTPLAEYGDLAPASTTSLVWPSTPKLPLKPDIVMEAGNMGCPPQNGAPDFIDELQLLTTNYQFAAGARPFVTFQDTSAAVAVASHLAATLLARYPNLQPETLRGFLVHCARWTPAMLARARDAQGRLDANRLLRMFGYGTPVVEDLFYSTNNCLTLIAQDRMQPFFKDEAGGIKTKDIKFHALPWPVDALMELPLATEIEMRVTLSYFIEPSPGQRGWDRKYGYPSHGLRFKVKRANETLPEFKLRVNAHGRDEEYDEDHVGETGRWDLGLNGATNGSIHSNIWRGTAADLAQRGHIAVYPTLGWWRTRARERRYGNSVHYSLIVTIRTPDQEIDIYTPVANQIGLPVEIIV